MNQREKAVFDRMVRWANAKGIQIPKTPDGMRLLMMQFLNDGMRQWAIGAAPPMSGTPPTAAAPSQHLLRDSGGLIDIASVEHEDSDFGDVVRQRAAALEEAGGDDLAAAVIHRNQTQQILGNQAPFVRDTPASAAKSILGNTAVAISGQQPIAVARWTADSDIETQPVTVTVVPVEQQFTPLGSAVAGTAQYRPYSRITFGTAGYSTRAEVDVGLGRQFTISGSMVQVEVALEAQTNTPPDAVQMQIAGWLSFKTIVRTAPLTRTKYLGSTVGIGTLKSATFVDIPACAQNVTLWREASSVAVTLFFMDAAGQLAYSYALSASAFMTDAIPLSGDIVQIGLSPSGTISSGRLIFGLSL